MTRQWLSRQSRSFLPALVLLSALLVPLFLAPASGAQLPLSGERICLDPGHGGDDPGALNKALLEKEINLDVSKALGVLLREQGAEVAMTRSDDVYLTNRDRYTFCNNWGATLLISVHTNSVDNDTWDGATTLWSKREDEALARAIHDVLYPDLKDTAPKPEEFLDFGLTKFQSGVLLKSDMPAAMMEPVFMSYPAEAALLGDAVYPDSDGQVALNLSCRRGQIVQAIYHGILNYYESTPAPGPGGKKAHSRD